MLPRKTHLQQRAFGHFGNEKAREGRDQHITKPAFYLVVKLAYDRRGEHRCNVSSTAISNLPADQSDHA